MKKASNLIDYVAELLLQLCLSNFVSISNGLRVIKRFVKVGHRMRLENAVFLPIFIIFSWRRPSSRSQYYSKNNNVLIRLTYDT